jgi:hypothetical protein
LHDKAQGLQPNGMAQGGKLFSALFQL